MRRTSRVKRAIAVGAIGVALAGSGFAGRAYAAERSYMPRHITRSQIVSKHNIHNHHSSRTHKHHDSHFRR